MVWLVARNADGNKEAYRITKTSRPRADITKIEMKVYVAGENQEKNLGKYFESFSFCLIYIVNGMWVREGVHITRLRNISQVILDDILV